jgi:hypothetical protein
MLVRNWMQADPLTVPSDALVSEAKRLLAEKQPARAAGRRRRPVARARDTGEPSSHRAFRPAHAERRRAHVLRHAASRAGHQSVGKALDQVGIEHDLFRRWSGHGRGEQPREALRVAQ